MFEEYSSFTNTDVIYFLLVEPGFYKFGVTGDICARLQTHKRTLKFDKIIGVYECPSKRSSFRVEQKFKKYAQTEGILVKKYGKTEIICTDDPQKYVDWFRHEILEEYKRDAEEYAKERKTRVKHAAERFEREEALSTDSFDLRKELADIRAMLKELLSRPHAGVINNIGTQNHITINNYNTPKDEPVQKSDDSLLHVLEMLDNFG